MRKIILITILSLLAVFLIFILIKETGLENYPVKISVFNRFLAAVSQIIETKPVKNIEVDLSSQKLRLYENGDIVKEFSVSSGSFNTPTPKGSFKVYKKSLIIYSRLANCWLFFWIGFTTDGAYGFHQVPFCPGEGIRGLSQIGKPASLGCVRLGFKESQFLYDWVNIGTPVLVYGKTPR